MDADGPWYGGSIAEIGLGDPEAADLNADGDVNDTLLVVVTRASDGWVLFADIKGDGSLSDDRAVHDYLVARETFGWAPCGRHALRQHRGELRRAERQPTLDLFFDTSAHGSHVAGIAAGHDIYGVKGFDGVAPGRQLLGLKIANDAQGGISRTGSMSSRAGTTRSASPSAPDAAGGEHELRRRERDRGRRPRIDHLIDSTLGGAPRASCSRSRGQRRPRSVHAGFPGPRRGSSRWAHSSRGVFLAGDDAPGPARHRRLQRARRRDVGAGHHRAGRRVLDGAPWDSRR